MSKTDELAKLGTSDVLSIPTVQSSIQKSDEDFGQLATTNAFLPRLQLMQSSSDLVKRRKLEMGTYGFVIDKENFESLGDDIVVILLDWRPKALRLINNSPEEQSFDITSAMFKAIMKDSESKVDGVSCMWGPELLVFCVDAKNGKGAFATHFLSSTTARRKADDFKAFMRSPLRLQVEFIDPPKSSYSWYGQIVLPCTTPVTNLPTQDEMTKILTEFNNPPADNKELAADASDEIER